MAVGRQGGFKHFSHEDGPELGSVWGGVPLMTNILFTIWINPLYVSKQKSNY